MFKKKLNQQKQRTKLLLNIILWSDSLITMNFNIIVLMKDEIFSLSI